MTIAAETIDRTIDFLTNETMSFLSEIIRIASTRGKEGPVNRLIYSRMHQYCDNALLMQIPPAFKNDPHYSWPMNDLSYDDTQNLRLSLSGFNPKVSRSLILNAHSDVVPPSVNQHDAFDPRIEDGVIYGRGACDDKGQIAVLYLVLRALRALGLKPGGDITIDIVVEEENGGNGSLFMVRNAVKADAAIVMEASEMQILSAVRGAVWFEMTCFGKPGHSGRSSGVVSALKQAIIAMETIERYHDKVLAESRGRNRLFDQFENPMPVTFGMLNAGDWPAIVPATATVKGVFGFLPNKNIREIQAEMEEALRTASDEWLRTHFEIKFNMLNNEGSETPEDHPLVATLQKAVSGIGMEPRVSAMTAACDAWRYSKQLNIPTVVMGAGSLKYAHANNEQIQIDEIKRMAKILIYFINQWCGLEPILGSH